MKTQKINTGFNRLTDAAFANKAESIFESMNGNPNFPTPVPALADVQNAVNAYSNALSTAQNRAKTDVAIKNEKRDELTDVLNQLANYVMLTANGNVSMLVSSGYDLAKAGEAIPITKPENLQVKIGLNPGELVVSVSSVKGARSYVHQYTADPMTEASNWTNATTTASRYTFTNLESAKKIWCRVAAVGTNEQVVVSDPLSRIVQ